MATQKKPGTENSIKKVALIVVGLFVLMIMTSGVAYIVAKNIAGNGNRQGIATQKNHTTYDAGEFLTNLADKGYIKLSLVYLLGSKDVEQEIQTKDSEIRDRIFSILRSKEYNDVRDSAGMEDLRVQIKESLNQTLSEPRVMDVYFTSIIVN